MIVIFALSSVPEAPHRPGLPHARNRQLDDAMRNTSHVVEYALLAGLVWRASKRSRLRGSPFAWAGVWALLYAASDEYHQSFVAGRTCSLQDWLIDFLGVALALVFLFLYRWIWALRLQRTGI